MAAMAAAEPAKIAPFRDRFARVAFNVLPIFRRPIRKVNTLMRAG
jgi:hypothetical protein